MKVKQIMTKDVVTIPHNSNLITVAKILFEKTRKFIVCKNN